MTEERDRQSYYGSGMQPWDLIKSLGWAKHFAAANVVKYVGRYEMKDGLGDLRKARWYLDRLIEQVEKERADGEKETVAE